MYKRPRRNVLQTIKKCRGKKKKGVGRKLTKPHQGCQYNGISSGILSNRW